MDQLCRPNYREEQVGALGKDINRERQRGHGKNESRWRSGSRGTNETGRVAGGSEWPIREQAISGVDEREVALVKEDLLSPRSRAKQNLALC